jgi:iodotyrosine deiodinase
MTAGPFAPLNFQHLPEAEMQARAAAFYQQLRSRRSVRDYSDRAVPMDVIESCLAAAGVAPSGANKQPWHFAVVTDPAVKRHIREAAEEEERAFYTQRASEEWLNDLAPLGTDANKPFLEIAPCLIAIFSQSYQLDSEGQKHLNYYVTESVGIATGILIAALHNAGLASLTHTPSPMRFLNEILGRPSNERPFLLLVVGYPAADAHVPVITKKPLSDIATFI